jgi:hypothetical protein
MSTGTILILVFAVAMIAMHLRSHGGHGSGHGGGHGSGHGGGHGSGHGSGCGGSHAGNSEPTSASKAPTVRVSDHVDSESESDLHPGR